jgi:hypothetical protein
MNRRTFINLAGLSIPSLLQAQYLRDSKAKNIIYIFLSGGISSQETFNPKPLSPADYRGPFGAIQTKTDGLLFSDRLPLLAQQTDKFTVIQSMTHGAAAHELGTNYMFTGYKPSPAIQYASLGSVVSEELGGRNQLPPYVTVPSTPNQFANAGFLSSRFNPFSLGSDPNSPAFEVRDLNSPVENTRFERRRNLLEAVDSKFKNENSADSLKALDSFYDQAFDLMSSQKAKDAFNLGKESERTKELYGKTEAGSRLLISRRLVEAGVRIVKVNYGSWDYHDNIVSMTAQLLQFDKALSALFQDLSERGILEETLVVVTSEFGRTPKINGTNGRDHWSKNFSTIIGGAGIKNGTVYGSTNEISTEVENDPASPEDLFATIFHLAGIDPKKELMTNDLRPIMISKGKILEKII